MNIIIILIITALVGIYTALPFFLRKKELDLAPLHEDAIEDPLAERLKNLNNQKENLYSAIKDIEFDYGLGKLSKEDYEELNIKYTNEAASVLKEIDKFESEVRVQNLDQELEQEILAYRKTGSISDEDIENEISAFRAAKQNCSSCGAEYSPDDLFCSKCGAKLK